MTNRLTNAAVGALLLGTISSTASASSIIANGSFETDVVPVGFYTSFACGPTITSWTVICPQGSEVAIVSGSFNQSGFSFPAQEGVQWLDLTGVNSNAGEGVQQTVATSAGTVYVLSFWVGNVSDPGGPFGITSTVEVDINGAFAGLFSNSGGTTTQTWEQFTLPILATGGSTTIAFINRDPSSDYHNGLDNISLNAIPEPATLLLFGTGTAALRLLRRRKGSDLRSTNSVAAHETILG